MSVDVMDKQLKSDLSCEAGKDFSKLFYDTLDKKRHLVSNLYSDTATLVWNGNPYQGKEGISKFYETLPICQTDIRSVDAQHLINEVLGQTTVLVSVSGIVKFSGRASTLFSESFLLTAQQTATGGNVWKIVSDCFRFHETVN